MSPDLEPSPDTPEWTVDVKFTFLAEGEESSDEVAAENWKLLTMAMALALTSLQPCQLRAQTDLVSYYVVKVSLLFKEYRLLPCGLGMRLH